MANLSSLSAPLQKKLNSKLMKAVGYFEKGNLKQAAVISHSILKTCPGHTHTLHLMALIEKQGGRTQQSIHYFQKAIAAEPYNPQLYYNLAVTLHESGLLEEAAGAYIQSLHLNPQNPSAFDNLGTIYQQQHRYEQAKECHQKAIDLNPNMVSAYNNLGEYYRHHAHYEQALECYLKAIERKPDYTNAMNNAVAIYKQLGQMEKAMELVQGLPNPSSTSSAQQKHPSAETQWDEAMNFLLQGRYYEGWHHYESGLTLGLRAFVDYGYPLWKGESLQDKQILILGEQDLADDIMFASCFEALLQSASHCFIDCEPSLFQLFKRSFPKAWVIERGNEKHLAELKKNPIDYQIPYASLPKFFRNHPMEFPKQKAYLTPDPKLLKQQKERLKALGKGLKIGVAWQGTSANSSPELEQWHDILNIEGIYFINLQYGECQEELAKAAQNTNLKSLDNDAINPLAAMDDYVALLASLDLLITADNLAAHLAGAIGTPTWLLLPHLPNWRWQLDCKDTPWYPSLTLKRQFRKANWTELLRSVAKDLQQFIKEKNSDPSLSPPKKRQQPQQKALLLNDTSSWYHWGCTCTSTAILTHLQGLQFQTSSIPIQEGLSCLYPPICIEDFNDEAVKERFIKHNQDIVSRIDDADLIIVNGEGSLHNISKSVLNLLYMAFIAKTVYQKPVHIINHSCYPEDKAGKTDPVKNTFYADIYKKMDSIAIRESISADLIESLGIEVIRSFDCLPLYLEQEQIEPVIKKNKTIIIAGSVVMAQKHIEQMTDYMKSMHGKGYKLIVLTGARAFPAQEDLVFIQSLKTKKTVPWEWVDAKSAREWLATIGEASLLVSGRFHHSIAAACLKTPFIILNSNTPKTEGIMKMLKLDEPTNYNREDLLDYLVSRSHQLLESTSEGRIDDEILKELPRLAKNNFAKITAGQKSHRDNMSSSS